MHFPCGEVYQRLQNRADRGFHEEVKGEHADPGSQEATPENGSGVERCALFDGEQQPTNRGGKGCRNTCKQP